jgi:uncharacterized DUF497 family protein
MTRIVIKKLVWDEYNLELIKKHKVSVNEVEEAIKNLVTHTKGKKGKYIIIGRSGRRIISIIVGREKPNIYYPVSARDAAKKERKKVYEKERK